MGGSVSSAKCRDNSHGVTGLKEVYSMLQNNQSLREAFTYFLRNEYGENLSFLSTPFDFNLEYGTKLKQQALNLLSNVFQMPSTPSVTVKSVLHSSVESANLETTGLSLVDLHFLKEIDENRKQIITLVLIGLFPAFLKSDAYQQWFWTRESPFPSSLPLNSSSSLLQSQSLFTQFHSNDFDLIGPKSSWFQTLCHSFDNLPISISIADATQRRFPLVYVNSAFQEMCGFTLHEIIGKSNKFLQQGQVEESMGTVMTETLGAGKPCRVFISNKRKDGTPFRNLLSMKPIFSLDGTYRFVIGMQFDVTNKSNSYIALCIAQDIFQALPSTCPNDVMSDEAKHALSSEF
jgi:PAS domain S-box-containing protein